MILKRGAILSPDRNHAIVIVEGAPGGDSQTAEESNDGRPPVRARRLRPAQRPERDGDDDGDKSTNRNANR